MIQNRISLAQRLLAYYPQGRYLEIGIRRGDNLCRVHAPRKVGVDPVPRTDQLPPHLLPNLRHVTIHPETSDEFFSQNNEIFDVIFIDGLHLYEQVIKDVSNAFNCLSENGLIFLHDCLPKEEFHATREFHDGAWTGDVWKAVHHIQRDFPQIGHAVFDCDWGLGLLWRKDESAFPVDIREDKSVTELPFSFFAEHKGATFNITDPADAEKVLAQTPAGRAVSRSSGEAAESPLVTIMIPTFNQADYVCEAVDSALAQTYENLEVVVSDDRSSDNTRAVLAAYKDNPRVRVFHNTENLGRVGNYRVSLYERARGEWVLNLDGDDFIHDPEWIAKAMERIASEPEIVMACAKKRTLYSDGTEKVGGQNVGFAPVVDGLEAFMALKDCSFSAPHVTALYHAELARELGFYSYDIVNTDLECTYRMLLAGKVAVFDEVVSTWRLHSNNASIYQSPEERVDNILCYTNPYDKALEGGLDRKKARAWLDAHLEIACIDAYALMKYDADVAGFRKVLGAVKTISPSVYYRYAFKPKFLLKQLTMSLGLEKPKKPHWLKP
ncbi:glycosyltransferase [Salidesulfovibrio onnuriiensis]|uniref:glycosyltransferase n=1 Tax=Salidesulfovibrio onnuriiensis TaxID=2583823 RepID=UPI0011C71AE3|nr:glycosyltransferase [Salidesulfovibrio onnuriiensis]